MDFSWTSFATTIADIAGDDDLRLGVDDAIAQGGVPESGINHRVHGADARASQHGDGTLKRERHIDDDAIAFLYAERFQSIGEAANLRVQLAIGDLALGSIFSQPDVGNAIAAVGIGVTIKRVDGDVQFCAGEPLVIDAVEVVDLVPRLQPGKLRA